jgi:hypothetical protein
MRTILNDSTANPNVIAFDGVIQELDEKKQVVVQWNTKDHFLITDATRDINLHDTSAKARIDYCHINTAVIDSADGNMIASFRHMDEVTKIDWKNTGEMIWRWGGKHDMFEFVHGEAYTDDTLHFSHQHDPSRIANGHITLWDNGNLHTLKINGMDSIVSSSRAVEYILDEIGHKATLVWEYKNVPYSTAAGNVQRLDNGNTMIGLGIVGVPSAIEVNTNNEVVYQLSLVKNAFAYRTYRFDFTINGVRQTGAANSFGFSSIYPNPAKNFTTVAFSVKDPGVMQIDLLDVLGHTVRRMSEKVSGAGSYTADIDMNNLPTGTYYCKLSQNGKAFIKMVILEK